MSRRLVELVGTAVGRLVAPALGAVLRLSARRAGIVLLFHGVAEGPGRSRGQLVPTVGRSRFRWNLGHLRRWYTVVPPERIIEASARRRRGDRFPVSLTFDDDLPEHRRVAMPELLQAEMPATFFLTGAGFDGMGESTWWQRVQRAIDGGVELGMILSLLPSPVANSLGGEPSIQAVSDAIIALPRAEREHIAQSLLPLAGPDPVDPALTRVEATQLVEAGFSVGFHTRAHDPLTLLDDDDLDAALRDTRDELSDLNGEPVEAVAYPYGYANERVGAAAHAAGFSLGFTCEQAPVTPRSDPLLLGRSEWPGASKGMFALRLLRVLRRAA